ncbi:unnamed protein product [Prunus brigantina]
MLKKDGKIESSAQRKMAHEKKKNGGSGVVVFVAVGQSSVCPSSQAEQDINDPKLDSSEPFLSNIPVHAPLNIVKMEGIKIPNRLEEAFQDPKWVEAMNVEMKALQKNRTWEIVP